MYMTQSSEYAQGQQQGILDRAYDISIDGEAYGDVVLADESPWAHGYRDGYLCITV